MAAAGRMGSKRAFRSRRSDPAQIRELKARVAELEAEVAALRVELERSKERSASAFAAAWSEDAQTDSAGEQFFAGEVDERSRRWLLKPPSP